MNVPLKWLGDYVKLPKNTSDLTDKLTSVGHMLDKTKTVAGDTVIDLELRGNRPDLLGLLGIAKEVAAIYHTKVNLPTFSKLPQKDASSPLVKVDISAKNLVTRYTALTLSVKVGPSPKWLVDKLTSWGVPTINNVVDITNFVLIETGQPMHAFDLSKLNGKHLVLRTAKNKEKFSTIQQGQVLSLTTEDLVICDATKPQALTMIGGYESKVTESTTEILIESAVYHQGNCRKSSRRHKIFTDSSIRHEKHLDPNQVPLALSRAINLLTSLASAKVTSKLSDYYPTPTKLKKIVFDPKETYRLGGVNIPVSEQIKILSNLGFISKTQGKNLLVTIPSLRTDIVESADIVEEVLRLFGYDNIPPTNFDSALPLPNTYSSYQIQEEFRSQLTKLGLSEVITLSMVPTNNDQNSIQLVNPPDPDLATLRSSLIPNLLHYAQKFTARGNDRVSIFEVGKVFTKSSESFSESLMVGIAMSGTDSPSHWNSQPKQMSIYHLKGIIDMLKLQTGIDELNYTLSEQSGVFLAEFRIDNLTLPKFAHLYSQISSINSVYEDVNVNLTTSYDVLIQKIKSISLLIKSITLVDKYKDKLTLRLEFHDNSRQLSHEDTKKVLEEIIAITK